MFPIESVNQISSLINSFPDLKGFNVTIPYKQSVIPFLHDLSVEARSIGAVNTVKIVRENNSLILKGYNTDAPAFQSELLDFVKSIPANALILGTGGASAAVAFALKRCGIQYKFVSRNPIKNNQIGYKQIDKDLISETKLIINCTPAGMMPDIGTYPDIPYQFLTSGHYLFDLVYNPEITEFLKRGVLHNANIRNGLGMLYKQAELAWQIWQET